MTEDATVTEERRRRFTRQFVPYPAYRWYMAWLIFWSIASAVVLGGLLWLHYREGLKSLLGSGFIESQARQVVREYAAARFEFELLVLLFFVAAVALASSILVSRLAGPIYRISIDLERALDEPQTTLQVATRRGDKCQELIPLVNRLLAQRHPAERADVGEAPLGDAEPVT